MTAEIIYKGGLRTEATHIKSGNKIITDAPVDNRGNGKAFSPTDLMATALASCHLTIMGIKAMDSNIDIEGSRAEMTKVMASDPRRIAGIHIKLFMPDRSFSKKEKAILEKTAESCPVSRSISEDVDIDLQIMWSDK